MELLFLHGPAASGKLTVARALSDRLNYGVFHNHLVVDALTAVFTFGSPPFVQLREQFWLSTFAEAAKTGANVIFTFAPESSVVPGFAERARDVINAAGGNIRFIELTVSEAEQERRIDTPSRHQFAKLTDVATLRRLRRSGDRAELPELPPTDLLIDTERLSPEASAQSIIDAFSLKPGTPIPRYANDQRKK